MHELAITQNMFDLIIEQAEKAEAKKIGEINLVIGELTGVVGDCVRFYFNFISKGTLAEEATLTFITIPPKAQCQECKEIFKLKEFEWTCPHCRSKNLKIIAGKELFIESIEVE